jgi:argininosuccinate lyase
VTQVLTGRVGAGPSDLIHRELLEPQFRYEAEHLLPWYILIEKVLLAEYRRMRLLTPQQVADVAARLNEVTADTITPDQGANLSDIAFAIERFVSGRLSSLPVAWHVDRSRNDLQACAQLMFCRDELVGCAGQLLAAAAATQRLAARSVTDPMPGYTHLQAAQVITPGFFFTALSDHLLHTAHRLLVTYDDINRSPLGAGAMAGQELGWDRDRMADLLGFTGPRDHALVSVASRAWALEIAAELSTFAIGFSRFITDIMTWASDEYGYIELPDELAGISSAMPQKKNYPVLERIRGKSAHLTSAYLDIAVTQRGTPFSNSVEVGKESTSGVVGMFTTMCSVMRLLVAVLDHASFRTDRMRAACEAAHLGGLSLANRLTLDRAVPWRAAQVIAGEYIAAAITRQVSPREADPQLLAAIARAHGCYIADPEAVLDGTADPDAGLANKRSLGSSHPDAVRQLLSRQDEDCVMLTREWQRRADVLRSCPQRIDQLLGTSAPPGTGQSAGMAGAAGE